MLDTVPSSDVTFCTAGGNLLFQNSKTSRDEQNIAQA